MSDGRDWKYWNDPPCHWCNESHWCRKPPVLPDCERLKAWKQANPDEELWPAVVCVDDDPGPEAA